MQRSGFRPAIARADLDENILRRILGVLHENVEIAIGIEDARIQEFIFEIRSGALTVGATKSS